MTLDYSKFVRVQHTHKISAEILYIILLLNDWKFEKLILKLP